ncbi:MAG: carboxypeptidase-like regulatory domain-containing protein [Bacteroidia bacterium]
MSVTPEMAKREYTIADAYEIQFAKDTHDNVAVASTLAQFNTFDPEFTAAFLAAFLLAIAEAEAVPSDEQVEAVISQLTQEVEDAMAACRKKYQDSKYFIEKAFPKNKAVHNEFGYEKYLKARDNQAKMIEFMKDFFGAATKYSAQLNLVNYTPAMITEIETIGNNLDTKNRQQNNHINNQPVITKERIDKHNIVWQITVRLCAAGKIIFYNNYSEYQKYLLPASDETVPFIVRGKVTQPVVGPSGGTPDPVEGVTVTVQEMPAMQTQTDSNGKYGFGSLPAGTYTLHFHKAGYNDVYEYGVVITDIEHPVVKNVTLIPQP